MGFLADGADNPISNPSALGITRVVFEHRRSLRAVLTLRRAISFHNGSISRGGEREIEGDRISSFYINILLTFRPFCERKPAEAIKQTSLYEEPFHV